VVLDIHLTHASEELRNVAGFALLGYPVKHTFQNQPTGPRASSETLAALADTLPTTRSAFAAHAAFFVDKYPVDRFAPLLDGDDLAVGNLLQVILRHVDATSDRRWVDVVLPLLEGEQALLATWILAKIPDERAVEPLIALIDRQIASDWVDEHAPRALGAIGDRRGVDAMLRVLEHPKLTTWFSAVADEIRRLGDASHVPRLEALAQRLAKKKEPWRDPKIVKQLIASLEKQPARG
jgi:HEAT repeat protein